MGGSKPVMLGGAVRTLAGIPPFVSLDLVFTPTADVDGAGAGDGRFGR